MNLSREQLEAMISAYLDDELSVEERVVVEQALSDDAGARALFADLQAMRQGLQSLPRARASGDMVEAIRARLERDALLGTGPRSSRGVERRLSSVTRWVAAASIVLMASAGGYVIWNLNRPDTIAPVAEQFAANERQTPASPAPSPGISGTEDRPADWAMRGRTQTMELADAGEADGRKALRALKKEAPLDAPMMPADAQLSTAGSAGLRERSMADGDGDGPADALERQTAMSSGEHLERAGVAKKRYAYPLTVTVNDSDAGTETGLGEQAVPAKAARGGAPVADDPLVLTVKCDDAEGRAALMDRVRSSAVLVRTITKDAQTEAALRPASRGGRFTRSKDRESSQVDLMLATPSRSASPDAEVGRQPAAPSAPAAAAPQAIREERVGESATAGEGLVTELLVVVSSEAARQRMVTELGGPAVTFGDGVPSFGVLGRTESRLHSFYADTTDATGSNPALPEDSFVFRPEREAGTAGRSDHAPASQWADAEGERSAGRSSLFGLDATASEPATTLDSPGFATSAPSDTGTPTEPPGYVVRLHITVRPPATAPAAAVTPGEPRHDPSVLELQNQPAPAPATTRPAVRSE